MIFVLSTFDFASVRTKKNKKKNNQNMKHIYVDISESGFLEEST